MTLFRPLASVLSVGLLATATLSLAQPTLFKCVDEKGVTHYGETMPAICAKKPVTEMSTQGRTVRKLDAPLTPEQQKARDVANAKQAEDDKKVADQRQKDLAMLGTYGSEREIDTLRDKDLAQVAQRRKFLEARMADTDARLEKVKNLMEFYVAGRSKTAKAKDGKDSKDSKDAKETTREVPPQVQADFDRAQSDKANTQLEIDRLDKDKVDVTARFEAEKERFRRLKNGMRPGTVLDDKGNVLIEPSLTRKPAPR